MEIVHNTLEIISKNIFSKIFRLFWPYDVILTPKTELFGLFCSISAVLDVKAIGGGLTIFLVKNVFGLSKTRSSYGSDAFYGMKKENRGPKL